MYIPVLFSVESSQNKFPTMQREDVERAQEAIRILSGISLAGAGPGSSSSAHPSASYSGPNTSSNRASDIDGVEETGAGSGRNLLRSRCSSAISSLRSIRVGLDTRESAPDMRSLFRRKRTGGPAQQPLKKAKTIAWTHKFVCLNKKGQSTIPTTSNEKDQLFEAGLGEKSLIIPNIDCDYAAFRQFLFEAFPKLEEYGGFVFAKCVANTRHLQPLTSSCLNSPRFLKDRVGNVRTYIIPLQRDLDMTPVKSLPSGISFIGEAGLDGGGPMREFWRLFSAGLKDKYLEGIDDSKVLRHNTVALQNKEFERIGRLMAMSFLQGGCGFPYFHCEVFKYIAGMEPDYYNCCDTIPDKDIREMAINIRDARDEYALRQASQQALDVLIDGGVVKAPSQLLISDQRDIVSALCFHQIILKTRAELDQLRNGLRTLGILKAIESHPNVFETLFTACGTDTLSPALLKSLFTGRVLYSASGSNAKEKEVTTYVQFIDFLEDCGKEGELPDSDSGVKLEDVLAFVTGASSIPPLGFPIEPELSFDHEAMYPTASTCALKLVLPTRYYNSYDQFKAKMTDAFRQHGGFGLL